MSRRTPGPIRISPGRGTCWSRAARLTASPVAKVDSASSTTTSPASTPTRASRPSSSHASTIASAARIARSASSSCALRDAERGHHRVAGELLDDAPVLLDALRDAGRSTASRGAARPRDRSPATSAGRVDEVDEQHGCELPFHLSKCRNAGPRVCTVGRLMETSFRARPDVADRPLTLSRGPGCAGVAGQRRTKSSSRKPNPGEASATARA